MCVFQVSCQLQDHAERNPTLQLNIVEARRRLAGQETSDLLRYMWFVSNDHYQLSISMPNNELLEGAVLLEELCKVSSIYSSKYVFIYCRR